MTEANQKSHALSKVGSCIQLQLFNSPMKMHIQYREIYNLLEQLEFDLKLLIFKIQQTSSIWDLSFHVNECKVLVSVCWQNVHYSTRYQQVEIVSNDCYRIESANLYFNSLFFFDESFFQCESCLTIITTPFRVQRNLISAGLY